MGLYTNHTDTELLELISKADRIAFKELHDRYFDALFRAAYNVLRDRDACLDIVQEVMVWFWEHREKHQIRNLKGYLLTAVKYQSANYIRSHKFSDHYPIEHIENRYAHQDDSLELKELQQIIKDFTNELPERCKEIFKMSREQLLTNKEIAEKLGISEKTVSVQILRALKKLRAELGNKNFLMFFFC